MEMPMENRLILVLACLYVLCLELPDGSNHMWLGTSNRVLVCSAQEQTELPSKTATDGMLQQQQQQPEGSQQKQQRHELGAQKYLRTMLGEARRRLKPASKGMRKFLEKLNGYGGDECRRFNESLNEAYEELNKLIELSSVWPESGLIENEEEEEASDNFAEIELMKFHLSESYDSQASNGGLHEQTEAHRRQQAHRAHETLGATVSWYLGCITRLSQLGSTDGLTKLLPFSFEMNTLNEMIELNGGGGGGGKKKSSPRRKSSSKEILKDLLVRDEDYFKTTPSGGTILLDGITTEISFSITTTSRPSSTDELSEEKQNESSASDFMSRLRDRASQLYDKACHLFVLEHDPNQENKQ